MGCQCSKNQEKDMVTLYSKYAVDQTPETNAGKKITTAIDSFVQDLLDPSRVRLTFQ